MDRSHQHGEQALDTRDAVAGKGKRKRRKRTTLAGTQRRINAKVTERRSAWDERAPRRYGEDRAPILSEDELLARDVTRAIRTERLSDEIVKEYVALVRARAENAR